MPRQIIALWALIAAYGCLAFIFLVGVISGWDGQAAYLTLPAVLGMPVCIVVSIFYAVWALWTAPRAGMLVLLGNLPITGFLATIYLR